MIRSIKQRLYLLGLLPLGLLAVSLVAINWYLGVEDARSELRNTRNVTAELLHGPAVDAFVVGNSYGFESIASRAIDSSKMITCITLRDATGRVVVSAGRCNQPAEQGELTDVFADANDMSDLPSASQSRLVGELRISLSNAALSEKRRALVIQLCLSLIFIGLVLVVVGRLLRDRLVTPIQDIDRAMYALGQGDYATTLDVKGDDELARLGNSINETIRTIERYTRELEQRRKAADAALQEADEANLAKDALIRSLTRELDEPMSTLHGMLTEVAISNTDAKLKRPIREAIASLQEAQANLRDLVEISTNAQPRRRAPPTFVANVIQELQTSVADIAQSERQPVQLTVSQPAGGTPARQAMNDLVIPLETDRLLKAVAYVARAMARNCESPGVFVTADFIQLPSEVFLISMHIKGFYAHDSSRRADTQVQSTPPSSLGWTDREVRVLNYLLREVKMNPTYSVGSSGMVSLLLELRTKYARTEANGSGLLVLQSICRTVVVTDDESMIKMATRADLTNDDVKVISLSEALCNSLLGQSADALVLDLTNDISDVFSLLESLRASERRPAVLIGVYSGGEISESLSERMFELGFAAVLQKPVQYSRILEVIRAAEGMRQLNSFPVE